jgi:hypothetical protein
LGRKHWGTELKAVAIQLEGDSNWVKSLVPGSTAQDSRHTLAERYYVVLIYPGW